MMEKTEGNRYRGFAENFPQICGDYLEELWMSPALLEALSVSSCFDARKIILTGSGAGYAAALAAEPLFTQWCDIFFGTEVVPQSEFNYFNNVAAMGIGEPNTPLVIVLTEEEDDPDATQSLAVAREAGANALLLCSGEKSAQAPEARSSLCLGVEAGPGYLPRAYLKLTLALLSAGARIARARGSIRPGQLSQLRASIKDYAAGTAALLPAMDEAAKDFARRCAGMDRFDYIADWEGRGAAHFLGTLGARELGQQYTVNDCEEWCHVGYWMEDRFHLCTVVFGNRCQPSFSRVVETMGCVHKLERPYLFLTDASGEEFLEGTRRCPIPSPPSGSPWMAGLVSWLPVLLALGYLKEGGESL